MTLSRGAERRQLNFSSGQIGVNNLTKTEEDSYDGSIEGEEEGKKNEFLHVLSRDNGVGTLGLQGLSTDPEGQEIQIRPEEDLPKEFV